MYGIHEEAQPADRKEVTVFLPPAGGILRILWIKNRCKFEQGCDKCVRACKKSALSFSDSLHYCRHCNPKYAPCKAACQNNAFSEKGGILTISKQLCNGCGRCSSECASNGISMLREKAVKCDLCKGMPCISACPEGALILEEGERGLLKLPAVESGSDSEKEDVTRVPSQPNQIMNPAEISCVGDGKKIPTIRNGFESNISNANMLCEINFRNLTLLPGSSAKLLESKGKARIYELQTGERVCYIDLPHFTQEEWKTAGQAKYFLIRESAADAICNDAYHFKESSHNRLARATKRADSIISDIDATMQEKKRHELARIVAADATSFGPIEFLSSELDDELEEIEINHPLREIVIYHKKHGRCVTNLALTGERAFRQIINSVLQPLGESLDDAHPAIDSQFPDGSRLHAQIYPFALSGASASIRFAAKEPWTIPRMVQNGMLDAQMAAFLWLAIESRRQSIVITGPPAAGKTSVLSSLLAFLPKAERVISIEEDMSELRFYDSFMDWVPLLGANEERIKNEKRTKRSMLDQVINALRMRPDRIVIGEMRGSEAQRIFAGANLGIPFATTMHSNENSASVLRRLHSPPMCVSAESLSSLDLVLSINFDSKKTRRVMELSEILWKSRNWINPKQIGKERGCSTWSDGCESAVINTMYKFDYSCAEHRSCESFPSFTLSNFALVSGISLKSAKRELESRTRWIQQLCDEDRVSFKEVGSAVREYYARRED